MNVEQRAPGWQVRCLKCGHTEPRETSGIRREPDGKCLTAGRCPACKQIRFHAIEKIPTTNSKKS